MSKYYLGIDIGTGETKGVLVNGDFEPCFEYAVKHTIDNPKPNFFEQDAEGVWWREVCEVSQKLLEISGISPKNIVAAGASVMGCDCIPVDKNCRPLRPAILYGIDARSQNEIEWLTAHYGEQGILERFGHPLCSDDVATKIMWLKNNEPENHKNAYKILTGSSYITAKLTGNYVIDQFLAKAAFRPLYRDDGSIDEAECPMFCRPEQLAGCKLVTDIAGCVTAEAARQTGLSEGTPVIVGTGDSTSEAVSAGVVAPGELMFQFGSSLFFYYCADRRVDDPRVHSSNFTVPGTFSVSGGTNAAGTLIRWIRDSFYAELLEEQERGGTNAFAAMAETISESSKGLVILPYWAGERSPLNDPKAKGVIFGLTTGHQREHIYRAALEAVACSVNQNIRLMEEVGLPVSRIHAVGGGTKNDPWMQIVADLSGKSVYVPAVSVGACYGDALMAAIGVGDVAGFHDLKDIIKPGKIFRPNGEAHEKYAVTQRIYDALYQATSHLMHEL